MLGNTQSYKETNYGIFRPQSIITLSFGLVLGYCLCLMYIISEPPQRFVEQEIWSSGNDYANNIPRHKEEHGSHPDHDRDPDHDHHEPVAPNPKGIIRDDFKFDGHVHENEDNTLADQLFKEVRVLCWVLTTPKNHKEKAIHVKRTWGQRCNKLIFMSSENDTELGAIALPSVVEGRNGLWGKTREAFKYVYENHYDEADWFLKADDDTYVIVENLRYMLYRYLPETPLYFGFRFKLFAKQGYMSGGAGYVLSKEAVRKFVTEAYPNATLCRHDGEGAEDAEMGKCLENIGVVAGDSRDSFERGRFFPFDLETHLLSGPIDPNYWYWKNMYYATDDGLDCCSDYAIAFHYIPPKKMYVYDYFIYHLKPYGYAHSPEPLPTKLSVEHALELFRNQTPTNKIT